MDFTDSHGVAVPLPNDAVVTWRVSAYAIVRNTEGKLLVVQAGNGQWHFPGGGVEIDEQLADAVARECREEAGYHVRVSDLRPLHLNEQKFYHSRKKEFYHSLQLFFRAELTDTERHVEFIQGTDAERPSAWLSPDELTLENTHDTIQALLPIVHTLH